MVASLESQLGTIYGKIRKDINDTMENEVFDAVAKNMMGAINMAYMMYESPAKNPYVRRYGNDGLGDRRNIVGKWQGSLYEVKNIAKTSGSDSGAMLDYFIVNGVYSWVNSEMYRNPIKRDFYEWTYQALSDNNNHIQAMKTGLEKRGYTIV